MRNKTLKSLLALMLLAAILVTLSPVVYADATLRIETSATTIAIGKTLTITVKVNGVPDLSSVGFDLKFDPNAFTYASFTVNGKSQVEGQEARIEKQGTNTIQLTAFDYLFNSDSDPLIATFRFTAKSVSESASFSISNIELGDYTNDVNPVPATFAGAKTVSVFQPSTNADLSTLSIAPGTLTPAFTSANTQYTVQVPESVTTLSVDAVPADAKAKVAVSGHTGLKTGENIVKVVVTAESGATKTYTIKAYKAVPTPTLAATPTPAATTLINGNPFTVATLDAGQNPPPGFSETTTILAGQVVPAYANAQSNVLLLYLSDSAGRKEFYVYDAVHSTFTLFQTLIVPEKSFIVLTPDASMTAPTGFVTTTLTIGGHPVSGYLETATATGGSPRTLVYLMDASGAKKLYVYQASTGEVSLFAGATTAPTTAATPGQTEAATPTPSPTGTPTVTNAGTLSTYLLIIIALAILVAVLSGILIYLLVSRKAYHQSQKPPTIRRVG